jgi:hypothetical protein
MLRSTTDEAGLGPQYSKFLYIMTAIAFLIMHRFGVVNS